MTWKVILTILVVVLCLVYVVSPIDLIPDVVPLAGLADDLAAVGATVATVVGTIKAFKAKNSGEDDKGSADASSTGTAGDGNYNDVSSN